MKILTLSTKQKFFDEIRSGAQKTETREIRPNTSHKYITYVDSSGNRYEKVEDLPEDDSDLSIEAKKYDAIKFLTGEYKGKRPYMVVEVLSEEVQFLTDENDEDITYEYEGQEYTVAQIVYQLGKVLEEPNV